MIGPIHGFLWDKGNIEKCRKHSVSTEEIEGIFTGVIHIFPDMKHSQAETRFLAIGKTTHGRHVFLAFTVRVDNETRFVRPISARYMHQKEIKYYEAQITKTRQ